MCVDKEAQEFGGKSDEPGKNCRDGADHRHRLHEYGRHGHTKRRGNRLRKLFSWLYADQSDPCFFGDQKYSFDPVRDRAGQRLYRERRSEGVLDFYPEYTVKRGEKTIQHITIKDMLTMTAPYKYKWNPYTKYFTSADWVKFSLDVLGGKGAIGEFRYAPIVGPDILADILVKATGQSVFDFATENLFAPLGITVEKTIIFHNKEEQMAFYKATDRSVWVAGPTGVNAAGWGLTLSPVDMAKIGQLFLNGGVWEGTRIVSEKWIAESTSEQSRWKQRDLPYGYLWWAGMDGNGYAAIGDGGNIIYVSPEKNMVVAIASVFYPRAKDRIEFIKEYVEPVFEK